MEESNETTEQAANSFSAITGTPSAKRKRSLSVETSTPQQPQSQVPPNKAQKYNANHLQINYLARLYSDDLPLVTAEDKLPHIISLLADYDGVLQRHESMAGNLGARPLGPMIIKRFERLFDGPPRVLKTHGKEGTTVTWLDVVEFARHKPEQFNLEKMRDGVRVCQFYTKQSRVEITEDDYLLVASGMPQKLIPPQPIVEDEEKELGTLEIVSRNLGHIVHFADQVSARARQLNHRLKNRQNAILSRRKYDVGNPVEVAGPSPMFPTSTESRESQSPTSGFVAVNSRESAAQNGITSSFMEHPKSTTNGTPLQNAAAATRADIVSKFLFTSDRTPVSDIDPAARPSIPPSRSLAVPKSRTKSTTENIDYASILLNSASPVPIPNTPSTLLPINKPTPAERYDDSGPYKREMMARMEQLHRSDRVMPPCDRCRRLHMDCLKNMTACIGCTKKHAKCSWKDVQPQELIDHPLIMRSAKKGRDRDSKDKDKEESVNGEDEYGTHSSRKHSLDPIRGVRDEELLGEDDSEDGNPPETTGANGHHKPGVSAVPQNDGPAEDIYVEDTTVHGQSQAQSPSGNAYASIPRLDDPSIVTKSVYVAGRTVNNNESSDKAISDDSDHINGDATDDSSDRHEFGRRAGAAPQALNGNGVRFGKEDRDRIIDMETETQEARLLDRSERSGGV